MTTENEIFECLDELRERGGINIAPYIGKAVILSKAEARQAVVEWIAKALTLSEAAARKTLAKWIDTFEQRHPKDESRMRKRKQRIKPLITS